MNYLGVALVPGYSANCGSLNIAKKSRPANVKQHFSMENYENRICWGFRDQSNTQLSNNLIIPAKSKLSKLLDNVNSKSTSRKELGSQSKSEYKRKKKKQKLLSNQEKKLLSVSGPGAESKEKKKQKLLSVDSNKTQLLSVGVTYEGDIVGLTDEGNIIQEGYYY